jgi:hypothetical protein
MKKKKSEMHRLAIDWPMKNDIAIFLAWQLLLFLALPWNSTIAGLTHAWKLRISSINAVMNNECSIHSDILENKRGSRNSRSVWYIMPLIVNVLAEFEDKKGRSLQLHE